MDGDGSQAWPLPAWLKLNGRMKERDEDKSKTAEENLLSQCWRYTWNVQAFRWSGMLSSFSHGKLLLLTTLENLNCTLNVN